MIDTSGFNSILFQILLIPIAFAIHEFEEWNILKWYKKHYSEMPESTDLSIRIWIIFISAIIFLLTFITLGTIKYTLVFSFIFIFLSAFILVNIIQHIIWTFQYKDYSLGLSTALILLFILIYVHINLINNRMINPWFYFITIYIPMPIIKTIKSPHVMTSEIRGIHNLGLRLEEIIIRKNKK